MDPEIPDGAGIPSNGASNNSIELAGDIALRIFGAASGSADHSLPENIDYSDTGAVGFILSERFPSLRGVTLLGEVGVWGSIAEDLCMQSGPYYPLIDEKMISDIIGGRHEISYIEVLHRLYDAVNSIVGKGLMGALGMTK